MVFDATFLLVVIALGLTLVSLVPQVRPSIPWQIPMIFALVGLLV
jgi:hypothetical protein